MSDEQDRPRDAGEAIREGVRSISGMLGALKEAIEETFDELRGVNTTTTPPPDQAAEGPPPEESSSAFRKAQETVEEVRDRFDFITRREFEALRAQVEALRSRLDERGSPAAAPASSPPSRGSDPPASEGAERADGGANESPGRYRFEVD